MQTIKLTLPKLHPGQQTIKDQGRRFEIICCGRRFGKSVMSRDKLARTALAGKPTAYFAPTYKMLADYWRETVAVLHPVLDKSNVQEKRLQLMTGGVIDMWSLDDPNAARGRKYAHIAIDEAAMIARLQEAWQEVLRPTLADYAGSASFYSTPKGRNFFWQLWQRGQDESQPEWASWQMPTSANPYILPEEIEAARLELPERAFAQEFLAQFLEDGGGVFRGVLEVATATPQDKAIEGHQYVIGADWGRQNDFTVLTVIDTNTNELVYIDRFNQIEYITQSGRLKALCERFKPIAVYAESNSIGEPIIERLLREDIPVRPFVTTNASKAQIIDGLSLAFERQELKILNEPTLIGELQAYEMERLPSGLIRYGAPSGMHDDCVMSLAMAWYGASQGSFFFI